VYVRCHHFINSFLLRLSTFDVFYAFDICIAHWDTFDLQLHLRTLQILHLRGSTRIHSHSHVRAWVIASPEPPFPLRAIYKLRSQQIYFCVRDCNAALIHNCLGAILFDPVTHYLQNK